MGQGMYWEGQDLYREVGGENMLENASNPMSYLSSNRTLFSVLNRKYISNDQFSKAWAYELLLLQQSSWEINIISIQKTLTWSWLVAFS